MQNEYKNSDLPAPLLRVKDPNENLEKCLQAAECCTHFQGHVISTFAPGFVKAPACRGRGAPWRFTERRSHFALSLLVFIPAEVAPARGGQDIWTQSISGFAYNTPDNCPSGSFPRQKGQMAIKRLIPTPAPVHTPKLHGCRCRWRRPRPQGAGWPLRLCGPAQQFRPWLLSSQNPPGRFQKGPSPRPHPGDAGLDSPALGSRHWCLLTAPRSF